MTAFVALAAIPLLWAVAAVGLGALALVEDLPGRHRGGAA